MKFDEQFKIEEDLLFNISAFRAAGDLIYTNERLYFYRENPNGVTKRRDYEDYCGAVRLLRKILNQEKKNSNTSFYINILTEYIETNLVLADIVSNYSKNDRRNIYKELRNNIRPYKKYRNMLKQYNKVLYKMFCHSDVSYLVVLFAKKTVKNLTINGRKRDV